MLTVDCDRYSPVMVVSRCISVVFGVAENATVTLINTNQRLSSNDPHVEHPKLDELPLTPIIS
jgi:hypothetical protein